MTIDRADVRKYVTVASGILTVWFGGVALVTLIAEPTPIVVVVGPASTALHAAVVTDAAVLDIHPAFSRLRSERQGFVRELYRAGAWFVWPAIEGGCFAQPGAVPAATRRSQLVRGQGAPLGRT
jgi:hypothetical protein